MTSTPSSIDWLSTTLFLDNMASTGSPFLPSDHAGGLYLNSSTTMAPLPMVHPHIIYARKIYVWLVPVMVSVLAVAVIGNGIIVFSSSWLSRPVNPYHRLCVSLAAADTWAASLLATGLIVNSYMPVVLEIHKKSECLAALLEIFRISGMLTSNLHIFALAVHQFVGIVYPLRYKIILTTRRQRLLIFILWVVPLIFTFSWFIAVPNDGFRHPSCRMIFYGKLPFRLSIFISFIVPLLATFALYTTILVTLMKAKAKCNTDLRRSMHDNYRRRVKSKLKLVWTTLLILSTFTLSWGLCVLYFVLVCIEGCIFVYRFSVSFHVGFLLNSTVNFLVMLKLVFNPLIYALRMRHIRKSVLYCLRTTCLWFCFRHMKTASSATNLTTNNGIITSNAERKHSRNTAHLALCRANSDSANHQRYAISSKKAVSGVRTIEENIDAYRLHPNDAVKVKYDSAGSSFIEIGVKGGNCTLRERAERGGVRRNTAERKRVDRRNSCSEFGAGKGLSAVAYVEPVLSEESQKSTGPHFQFQFQQVPQNGAYVNSQPVVQYRTVIDPNQQFIQQPQQHIQHQIIQQPQHIQVQQTQHASTREGKCPVRGKTSPYGFFVKMCYEEHKKKYPGENVQVTEISKKCAEKWKTMNEDEKRRFYELAHKDAERYQAEIQAYGGEDLMRKKKRAKKDPNAPKRALSAFFFFSNEKRPEVQTGHPEWKVGQVAQELGRMWKALTDEEKAVYEQKANMDKQRYADEMKNYREQGGGPPLPGKQDNVQVVQQSQPQQHQPQMIVIQQPVPQQAQQQHVQQIQMQGEIA
ncbi:hypothetical protein FO519_001121 [Halicephalobus sp. NKZ332]|nr:hypothetical protein FO519_001121 [Halicephalobus sp. NKZ332]